ncbi:MAG: aminoacetone oxidase family FAD-binding enzyme [Lachnospiraceae bacterium]|nr:aminoacetone oxidase family FAD-binding enzyme [Lachnospiraceae bacterium]
MTEFHETIIIGAGAAGLMAAYWCCRKSGPNDVIILERNSEAGKKITATGNGKCNFTNKFQDSSCYRSEDSERAFSFIKRFNEDSVISFFEEIGLPCYERNGYCYPVSEQAKSVRDSLENRVFKRGARIIYDREICKISANSKSREFILKTSANTEYSCNNLIIACGGKAYPKFGSDGSIFKHLKELNITLVESGPSLVGLKSDSSDLKHLDGVRCRANISLFTSANCSPVYEEYGEIIFNKSGISGIPVLNASRFAVKALQQGKKTEIKLDLYVNKSKNELTDYLCKLFSSSGMSALKAACGLLNDKLFRLLLIKSGFEPEAKIRPENDIKEKVNILADNIKNFTINITGDAGYDNAQTSLGGVAFSEVDDNLQSIRYPGLFFAGEILDVDGKCGGYNLQWAWTSGYIAANGIKKRIS